MFQYKINKIVVENNTIEEWLYICMEVSEKNGYSLNMQETNCVCQLRSADFELMDETGNAKILRSEYRIYRTCMQNE